MLEHRQKAIRVEDVAASQLDAGLLAKLTREADAAELCLGSVHANELACLQLAERCSLALS